MLPKQTIHISSAAPYLPDDEISDLLLAVEELTHGVCRAGVVRDHSRLSRLPISEAIIEYRLSGPDSPKELTIRFTRAPGPYRQSPVPAGHWSTIPSYLDLIGNIGLSDEREVVSTESADSIEVLNLVRAPLAIPPIRD